MRCFHYCIRTAAQNCCFLKAEITIAGQYFKMSNYKQKKYVCSYFFNCNKYNERSQKPVETFGADTAFKVHLHLHFCTLLSHILPMH